jgi:hypothetical protein
LTISIFLLFILTESIAEAQHPHPQCTGDGAHARCEKVTGIITHRIPTKSLQRWNTIKQFVLAKDTDGEPLHPMLRGLWDRLENSSHAIYIELPANRRGISCLAGSFRIEKFDPSGRRHVGVIRLNLDNIDAAYVGPEAMRPSGFIPFQGLSKEERYAEVLGHEMAHATSILEDLNLVAKVDRLVEQTNVLLLSNHAQHRAFVLKPEIRQRLIERDSFLADLEQHAEAIELIVWQELLRSNWIRTGPR